MNPLYSYSIPRSTRKVGLKDSGVELEYTTDDKLGFLLKNDKRGGPASVMGNRYVKGIVIRKIQHWHMNKFYGSSFSRFLLKGSYFEMTS